MDRHATARGDPVRLGAGALTWTSYLALSLGVIGGLALALTTDTAAASPVGLGNAWADDVGEVGGNWPRRPGDRSARRTSLPVHRCIFAVDVEHSTQRTNPVKEELRRHVYQLVGKALDVAGITDMYRDPFIDRGDGVLVLIHPVDDVPKPVLLARLIPALADLLARRNASVPPCEQSRLLRMRAVIHAGEVHQDGNGFFGEDLDVACRLLDAPRLKAYLRKARVPLALAVSDEIYWSVIRHGYDGIDGNEFRPIVTVTVGGRRRKGWVQVPGD
jgi:hypothetical protein